MRKVLALAFGLMLVAASCGSDDDSGAAPTTSEAAAPQVTEVEATTSTETETSDAPTTTEAESTDTTEPDVVAAVPLTPEVICSSPGLSGRDYAFAYVNDSAEAVVLDPTASFVTGGEVVDAVFTPVVFAPGRVSPAFWVTPADLEAIVLPSWTIVGPDGVSRTAAADASTPECTDELVEPTTPDTRVPLIEISNVTRGADGVSVSFDATLTGVDASVCPSGLDVEDPSITTDDGAGGHVTDGPTSSWTTDLFAADSAAAAVHSGYANVAVLVLDQCSAQGTTQAKWPGGAFEALYDGILVCIDDVDGTLVAVTEQDPNADCEGLPNTGGSRTRPA